MSILNRMKMALQNDAHFIEMLRGAVTALGVRILGAASGLLLSITIARMFGVKGSGSFYLLVGIVTVLSALARCGLDNSVVKFVAKSSASSNWLDVKSICTFSSILTTVSSLTISILLFMFSDSIANIFFHNADLGTPIKLVALALTPLSLALINAELLRGLRNIAASAFIKTGAISLATLLVLLAFGPTYGINGALYSYIIASFLALLFSKLLLDAGIAKQASTSSMQTIIKEVTPKTIMQSSWPMLGVVIAGLIIQNGLTILLGLWSDVRQTGIFAVANQVTSMLLFPLMASVSVLAPKFATLHNQQRLSEISKLAKQSSLLLSVFVIPVSALAYIFASEILSLFGNSFIEGVTVLRILLVGVIVNVMTGAVAEILVMTGHERSVRSIHIVGAVVVTATGYVLIPVYDAIGASIASALGFTLINVLMVIKVKSALGFWPLGLSIKMRK